ncbi:AraC family transcriptional regulator [Dyella sp. LX-66]|uniref:AraC family transcriptional regulator n=1 Tax=unclassified Dyella TaxID=2634549 RepID=UPI001BDF83AD|nr:MULTISPECIES: AraC family transcriptional regulator [unclassified Dyella]MBT2118382.1 AraC family transcriptional regulator [Dyella sp. LX-1]MBT2140265.1 AraC family transcriptional regulator [Dyella sp. LX-66]
MADTLVDIVKRHTDKHGGEGFHATPIKGFAFLRTDRRQQHPTHLVSQPVLCVVVQGAKCSVFGSRRHDYRAGQALVVSVDKMPGLSRVTRASPAEPYLCIVLEFDAAGMREMLESLPSPPRLVGGAQRGIFVTDFAGPLTECVLRMARLLDTPEAIPVLAPMMKRELYYWLLAGPHGGEIANVVLGTGHTQRMMKALHKLRDQFREPVRIDELAAIAQLSPSAFHRQFKALTAMTPLQYQKQLRLLEARHLMMAGVANAESAAYRVGYESPSQFSREYARMFGAPPRRDVVALNSAVA